MNSFVNIVPVSQNKLLSELSEIYEDNDYLKSAIDKAVGSFLPKNDIEGKRLLLKPNWVKHPTKAQDNICLCTHPNFILAFVELLIKRNPQSILIADAPIQGCNWSALLTESFINKIKQISLSSGIEICIKDFRRVLFSPRTNEIVQEKKNLDDYIIFDVAEKSYLEDITSDKNLFRVTCYNPDRLAESHHKGVHKYCIARDVFKCDTIITIPKIKTHQKTGLTNSMKILVGINGDKDYLPHHRIGAIESGGDCYKGKHPFRRMSELLLDEANRHIGHWAYRPLSFLSTALWRLSRPTEEQNLAAGWYGNDTVWRMVMDLNMIAQYGRLDGTLALDTQRTIYTLCDGVIGGQGNGPLSPDPLSLGIIAFANDAFAMDEVVGRLFKLNLERIPLLREAKRLNEKHVIDYYINGSKAKISDVDNYAVDVVMPPGWINYNKSNDENSNL